MSIENNLSSFGERIRALRKERSYTLQFVSEKIGVDTSLLAKFERNERKPSRKLIKSISAFFNCEENELLNKHISDQIAYKILSEDADVSILKVAEEKVKYLKNKQDGK